MHRALRLLRVPAALLFYLPPPGTVAVGNGQEPSFGAAFARYVVTAMMY